MSYDLSFWRYEPGIVLNHQSVYERLSDGYSIDGLEKLPIEKIIRRIHEAFADWELLNEETFDGGERGAFQLHTTSQSFRVDCYGVNNESINRLIEIGREFQCPLYDPQVNRRFDSI